MSLSRGISGADFFTRGFLRPWMLVYASPITLEVNLLSFWADLFPFLHFTDWVFPLQSLGDIDVNWRACQFESNSWWSCSG